MGIQGAPQAGLAAVAAVGLADGASEGQDDARAALDGHAHVVRAGLVVAVGARDQRAVLVHAQDLHRAHDG